MKSAGNLGGVIYRENLPIIKFKFKSGILVEAELLTERRGILPIEIVLNGLWEGLPMFIIDRPTPDTRIGIHEELKETPIQYYDIERMLRYNHAQSIHDCYWLKQDSDKRCWNGTCLENVGIQPNNKFMDLASAQKWK